MEIWKPIHSLNDKYEASNEGRIRNIKTKKIKSVVFDGHYWKFGFDYVFDGKRHMGWYRVHKAVAETFIPNDDNKPTVNHIDGNTGNNAVDNLEWATRSEQTKHVHGVLGHDCGEKSHLAKLTNNDVKNIRSMYEKGMSVTKIAKIYGVTHSNISLIVNFRTWKNI